MRQILKKIYCFVDETGQDTLGNLFLVAIVFQEGKSLEVLEDKLLDAEKVTNKKKLKWKLINNKTKEKYLKLVFNFKELINTVYYSINNGEKKYSKLTGYSLAKAILKRYKRDEIIVTVIVDGLNDKDKEIVQRELKALAIHYNKVRGMKDEQSVILRLADAMAGFLRDYYQKEKYAVEIMNETKGKSAPIEV